MRGHTVLLTLLCLCCAIDPSRAQTSPATDSLVLRQTCPEESEAPSVAAPLPPRIAEADDRSPIPTTRQETPPPDPRSTRGLTSLTNRFVPKGQWVAGISASYSTHTNDSYNFLVIDNINSDGYNFKISPLLAYAVRDNMAVGAKFIYSRSLLQIDNGEINLGDDDTGINLSVDLYHALRHTYSVGLIWRQYIPLGRSKRFALFNEASLTLGGGQARFAADTPVRGTYETSFTGSIGVSPGLVAFATNNLAFELNVGVMGISYTRTRQVHNQVTVGKRSSSMLNLKVNILSIGLGVSFYL